jgi:hypothetical protein
MHSCYRARIIFKMWLEGGIRLKDDGLISPRDLIGLPNLIISSSSYQFINYDFFYMRVKQIFFGNYLFFSLLSFVFTIC